MIIRGELGYYTFAYGKECQSRPLLMVSSDWLIGGNKKGKSDRFGFVKGNLYSEICPLQGSAYHTCNFVYISKFLV